MLKRGVTPLIAAVGLLWLGLTLTSHLLFHIGDAIGWNCTDSPAPISASWMGKTVVELPFKADDACFASGIQLTKGRRYHVAVTIMTPWKDGDNLANGGGLDFTRLPWTERISRFFLLPLRRVFLRPWFRIVARIGSVGTDEYFVDPDRPSGVGLPAVNDVGAAFRARRDGELFLYVNDAVVGIPALAKHFYRDNSGEAKIVITHLPR